MTGSASAPASSGNLGPGFDCIGLALDLRCLVVVRPADDWLIRENDGQFVPSVSDLVVRAATAGGGGPFHIDIENAIPRSRGLGSSAAVATAVAAAAARAVGKEPEPASVYRIVADLEGHGDNAGAAVFGGLVLTDGDVVRHLTIARNLRVVVAIPDYKLKTSDARSALPGDLPRAAVARNLARLGFLIEGLRTGDVTALAAAGGDEVHEVARAGLSPLTGELMVAAHAAGALHVCWSGAGPTAMAITTDDHLERVMAALTSILDSRGEVRELEIATDGLR